MNELNEQVKELKNSIFKITEHLNDSESNNQILAFKKFVNMSLKISLNLFLERYKLYGVKNDKNGNFHLSNSISLGEEFLISDDEKFLLLDDADEQLNEVNIGNHINSFRIYERIVKSHEPFTDVISALANEMGISTLTEKANYRTTYVPDEPCFFADMCAGYGSLILERMKKQYNDSKKSLKQLRVIVNDSEPLAANVVALQVLMNTIKHDIDIGVFAAYCSDLAIDLNDEKPFVISFKTPQCVLDTFDNIREEKITNHGINQ